MSVSPFLYLNQDLRISSEQVADVKRGEGR